MATSGSITKYFKCLSNGNLSASASSSADAVYSLTFSWEATSNIISNTSVIAWSLKASAEAGFTKSNIPSAVMGVGEPSYIRFGTDDVLGSNPYDDIAISVAGTKSYNKTNLVKDVSVGQKNVLIDSGSFTVTHDSTGNYSAAISCTLRVRNCFDVNNKAYFAEYGDTDVGSKSASTVSGTLNLDTIPRRAVLLTAEDFTDENPPTITYVIPTGATNVKAVISLSPSTYSADIVKTISGSEYTFSFTDADKAKLWAILKEGLNAKQVSFWITSTFNGTSRTDGPIVKTLTINNYTPVLDPVVTDGNDAAYALTGNRYKLIRHVSHAVFDSGATARKGATITEYLAVNNGKPLYSKTGTFENVASPDFYFAATDDAGRTVEQDYTIPTSNWVPYIKLTCSAEVTEMTADGDVAITLKGKFFNGSFSSTKTNRMRMHYDIAENNEDWEHVDKGYIYPTVDSEGNYTYTFTITGLNYMSVYELTVRVSDEVAVEGTEARTVIASTPIFDWGRTDFNFNVPVTIQGGSVPTLVAQSLSDSGWSYRKWSDGTAECWRTLSITATVGTATNANWYSSGELSATNLSFPFTFVSRPTTVVSVMPTGTTWAIVFPSNTNGSTTKTGSYQLNSMSSLASKTYLIAYDVKGRWK
jgi:hypothetical protein